MPFVFIDGFDHESAFADLVTKWSGCGPTHAYTLNAASTPFGKGQALELSNIGGQISLFKSFSALGRVIWGAAVNPTDCYFEVFAPSTPAGFLNDIILFNYQPGTQRFNICLNGNFNSPIGNTPNNSVPSGVWSYVEFDCTFSLTAGIIKVNVNGSNVVTLTGVAMNSATAQSFGVANDTNTDNIDDLYILDPNGESAPYNNMLGPVRVQTLYPNADVTAQWTPLSGSNFSNVNAAQFNGGTSYNHASVLTDLDDYDVSALFTNPTTIFGVGVTGAFENDTNTDTSTVALRFNGAAATGVATPSNNTYAYQQSAQKISAWSNPTIGYALTANTAGNARASQLVAEVLTSQSSIGPAATPGRGSGFKWWWREKSGLIVPRPRDLIPAFTLARG